jgi:hypothetical protein
MKKTIIIITIVINFSICAIAQERYIKSEVLDFIKKDLDTKNYNSFDSTNNFHKSLKVGLYGSKLVPSSAGPFQNSNGFSTKIILDFSEWNSIIDFQSEVKKYSRERLFPNICKNEFNHHLYWGFLKSENFNNQIFSDIQSEGLSLSRKSFKQQSVLIKTPNNYEGNLLLNIKANVIVGDPGYGPGYTAELQYNITKSFSWVLSVNPNYIYFTHQKQFDFSHTHLSTGPKIYLSNENFRAYVSPGAGITMSNPDGNNPSYFSLYPAFGTELKINQSLTFNTDIKLNFYFWVYIPAIALSIDAGINIKIL